MNNVLYCKLLYTSSKEYNLLKKNLLKENLYIKLLKKEKNFLLANEQYFNVYLIYSKAILPKNTLIFLKNFLKNYDIIQILGIVEKNVLKTGIEKYDPFFCLKILGVLRMNIIKNRIFFPRLQQEKFLTK